jgi:hypothetical protein
MSAAIRLVIGSVLDRLPKASQSIIKVFQSIVEEFLKHLHNPDATEAQVKAMQERIDHSKRLRVVSNKFWLRDRRWAVIEI